MAIRVVCPKCGRIGRGPDHAVGYTVLCPGCSHRHRLTPEMVLPDDGSPEPAPKAGLKSDPTDDAYVLAEPPVDPPKRPVKRAPVASAVLDDDDDDDRRGRLGLPLPAVVGGGIGIALLVIVVVWAAVGMSRGRDRANPGASASDSSDKPSTSSGTTATDSLATVPRPAPAAPGQVSVIDAMQTTDVVATESEGDSAVAAKARAGAASVGSGDRGAGKALSTAEIVAESEPSVALIKGKGSSGTGFLVAPGLLATNAHVIDDEFVADLEVLFVSADMSHKGPVKAELLYQDPERDLAFLAVQTDLKPLRVARTYAFRKGEDITVIGNPGMGDGQVLENAISRGVMSTKTQLDGRPFYQLGIAVNPGNSGGPVFDSSGRVIGVVTLKATKQEATSFSIPIEDVNAALATLAKQTDDDANRYRSGHRLRTAVKDLGGAGALMCLIIDLRRLATQTNDSSVRELLSKLEPIASELDQDASPSMTAHASQVENDPLVAPAVQEKVGDLVENFGRIRDLYAKQSSVDDSRLRPLKQTHRGLLNKLSAALKLEFPPAMMVAFDDHAPSRQTLVTMGPQGFGMLGPRLRRPSLIIRPPTRPHGISPRLQRGRR